MTNFLYLTGSAFNFLARGTVTVSPTASSVAGAANLYDGDPSTPHIAGSVAADSYMQVQIQALTNPGFETSTLSGWTAGTLGTGTSAETTTAGEFRTGAKALELTGTDAANYGSRYQDITVAAGEWRKATVYIKAIGAGTGKLYLRNLRTGLYHNGSTWASTRAAAGSSAVTDWTAVTVTYQIESYDTCRADTVTLRWELACESGDACFDDCLDVPGVTFASIHGHNYGPVSPVVASSTDGASFTTRATMTVARPAFFSTFSIIYAEYWRITLTGTNHEAPYTGEAVLGQYQTSTTPVTIGPARSRSMPGTKAMSPGGRTTAYNYAIDPRASVGLFFTAHTAAAAQEIADSIWLRSGQGRFPVIVVPIDTEASVYFGRLDADLSEPRPLNDWWEYSIDLVGDPFPTVGA